MEFLYFFYRKIILLSSLSANTVQKSGHLLQTV